MSSRTPYMDMERAFWTYLNKQRGYQDLRLNEFRFHDGRIIPFDPKRGLFPVDRLPAIYTVKVTVTPGIANEQQVTETLEMKGQIVYAADQSPPDRGPIERAFVTISDILGSFVAQTSRLDAGDLIDDYDWKPGGPVPAPDLAQGLVRFWVWDWAIALTGRRHAVIV